MHTMDWTTDNLDALHGYLWDALEGGASHRTHSFHTMNIATVREGRPEARTVVLRHADRASRTLRFHTDARSPKLEDLRACPEVLWHGYDREWKIQLRIEATAEIHIDDDLAREAWDDTPMRARRCYLIDNAPGTPRDTRGCSIPSGMADRWPEPEESEAGWKNFAIVRTTVRRIHFLYLTSTGNEAAEFAYADGSVEARWVEA